MIRIIFFALLVTFISCGDDACPEHYTGENCETEIKPRILQVNEIKLLHFPDTTTLGHELRDIDNLVIYFDISTYGSNGQTIYTSRTLPAFPGEQLTWDTDILLNLEEDRYYIEFHQNGSTDVHNIGGISFTPYTAGDAFPINIEQSSIYVTIRTTGEYIFDDK